MRTTALAMGILLLATAAGCAGNRQEQASADASASTDGAGASSNGAAAEEDVVDAEVVDEGK